MTKDRSKSAKPTPADAVAAAKLRVLWARKLADAKASGGGWTQETAGAAMGITQGAVSQYLSGRIGLGYGAVLKFAQFLGVAPTDIRDDLDSLPRDADDLAQSGQLAESIKSLKGDVTALRSVSTILAIALVQSLPDAGAKMASLMRDPDLKIPHDKRFLSEFLQSVELFVAAAAQQPRHAASAGARKFR